MGTLEQRSQHWKSWAVSIGHVPPDVIEAIARLWVDGYPFGIILQSNRVHMSLTVRFICKMLQSRIQQRHAARWRGSLEPIEGGVSFFFIKGGVYDGLLILVYSCSPKLPTSQRRAPITMMSQLLVCCP